MRSLLFSEGKNVMGGVLGLEEREAEIKQTRDGARRKRCRKKYRRVYCSRSYIFFTKSSLGQQTHLKKKKKSETLVISASEP